MPVPGMRKASSRRISSACSVWSRRIQAPRFQRSIPGLVPKGRRPSPGSVFLATESFMGNLPFWKLQIRSMLQSEG